MKKSIIKHLLLVCIMILSVAAHAAADNIVDIGSVEGKPGDIVELRVGLTNSDNVSSVQISIPIDSRLELVEKSAMTTDRTSKHKVTAGVKDGKLNIFVYSMSMDAIAPGSGDIATVRLKLGNAPSSITLSADKVVITDSNGTTLPDATATDGNATILCAKSEYSTLEMDYGRVPIRSSYHQTVRVSNVGNAPLIISGLQFSATEFSCNEAFPIEIEAGSNREFTINYAPVERGGITEEVKFLCNSIYKLNTVKLKALPFAVNELHVENAEGVADSIVTVALRMNNMDDITGFQFDFNIPEQLEYVDGSFALSSRKTDHQMGASMKGRTLHVLAFSLSDSPFTGNDGVIATFKVKLNGRYGTSLGAAKAMLTANIKGKLTDVLSDKYDGYINILSPRINATDEIDLGRTPITQVAKTSFHISNYGSAPLRIDRIVSSSEHLKVGAQLPIIIKPSERTDIDVMFDDVEERDYNEQIQLYTNDPDRRLHNIKVRANRYSPNYITLTGADVEPGDTLRLQIALSNNDVVNGLQFDVDYETSCFDILDKYEWSDRAKGFTATNRSIGNGKRRYFCYSFGGGEIAKGDGNVMTILLPVKKNAAFGNYNIQISNILLSTPGLTNKYSGAGNNAVVNVVKPIRTINITDSEHGSVEGGGSYDLGTIATLTAIPDKGYSFDSWSDGNTDNPRTITVNEDIRLSAKFTPNSYSLKYVVDGKTYKTETLEFGTKIVPVTEPTKEGYTFSGWSEIPKMMPAHDVTVNGSFSVNTYSLKYVVDGAEYKTITIEYGATITPEANPKKEGYTFSGWSEIPETMPAHDVAVNGSFSINSYTLEYTVDGEVYKTITLEFGAMITPEAEPTKEGYTFSGWSEIPETMPAHDVTINGSFSINSYTLEYIVDGEVYKTITLEFGATITPEAEPTKEGYTFSGWSEIPETMPAHDVTVNGSFSINSYTLEYIVDGEVYKTITLEFGATITPEAEPTKEGYTFSGWSEIPKTMPAHDVTVSGSFTVNSYTLKYIVDGEEYKSVVIEYGAEITPEAEPTKEGYTFSGWSEIPETMPAHDVMVSGSFAVNIHKVTWKINEETIAETEVEYGEIIIEPEVPVKEGYKFEGWDEHPKMMPDYDITINGKYSPISIIKQIMADHNNVCVYTTRGILVGKKMTITEIMKLPKGIYIINRKAVTIK